MQLTCMLRKIYVKYRIGSNVSICFMCTLICLSWKYFIFIFVHFLNWHSWGIASLPFDWYYAQPREAVSASKRPPYRYRNSDCKHKMVPRPSYLYDGDPHILERQSWYWDRAHDLWCNSFYILRTDTRYLRMQNLKVSRSRSGSPLATTTECIYHPTG